MNKTQLKQHIEKEIARTKKRICQYFEEYDDSEHNSAIDANKNIDSLQSIHNKKLLISEAEEKLRKLSLMLELINHPDFGICKKCRMPIRPGLLFVFPQTSTCVKCSRTKPPKFPHYMRKNFSRKGNL